MVKKVPTKPVDIRQFEDYWQKSQDFFRGMGQAYTNSNWNSAALEGIHAAISASDAVLIFSRGYRSSSERHLDVATLISGLAVDGARQAAQHLSKILGVKSLVEYSGDNYSQKEAEEIVRQVERFLNWARKILPK